MKVENAIEVRDLYKSFKVYSDRGHNLRDFLFFSKRRKYERHQVLKGISFEVKKGEAIGLIGHNGCGKSTTLKMLTRIMYPDSGCIEMRGRVSSLIELGAGFHPDLTGRENIYINASIFGLTRKEIDNRIEDIIIFSELGEAIEQPVRTYSSGMYMRLAFSVAINVDADILLIDEILAVGDTGFQVKCFNKLKEIKGKGVTIVIVSHSLGQIEQICEKSYWIKDGKIKVQGVPRDVHPQYLDYIARERQELSDKESVQQTLEDKDGDEAIDSRNDETRGIEDVNRNNTSENKQRWGNGRAKIEKVWMYHQSNNRKGSQFTTSENVGIHIEYCVKHEIQNAIVGIGFFRADGVNCYGTNTNIDRLESYKLINDGIIDIKIENFNLLGGHYLLDVAIHSEDGLIADYWRGAIEFDVYSRINEVGVFRMEHKWIIQ